jgi:transcriptional regulator with XRE-family HTH domain
MPEITLTQGERIRYAREKAGLKQEELAALLRVSRPALSAWERDENKKGVSFTDLEAIARHTSMPVEFFLGKELAFTVANSRGYKPQRGSHFTKVQVRGFRHPSLAA